MAAVEPAVHTDRNNTRTRYTKKVSVS